MPHENSHPGTILIVEDETHVRGLLLAMMRRFGYAAVAAADSEEALALADHLGASMALLLTDVNLPGIDGRQLAHRIRSARPELRVLFASGYTADVVDAELTCPRTGFLQKPYSPVQLRTALQNLLTA